MAGSTIQRLSRLAEPRQRQRRSQKYDCPRHRMKCSFQGNQQSIVIDGDYLARHQGQMTLHRGGPSSDESCRRAELALRCRKGKSSHRGDHWAEGQATCLGDVGNQNRERAPRECEPDIGMNQTPEQLQVVGQAQEGGRAPRMESVSNRLATLPRCPEPSHRLKPTTVTKMSAAVRNPGAQWTTVQLVECMRGEPDGTKERQ